MALSSCSGGSDGQAGPTTVIPPAETTTSSSLPSSTTAPVSTTVTTARPTTTSAAASPESFAEALYAAWTKGDRAAAEQVAQPAAVTALFARPWQASDGWAFAECSGAAGSIICRWRRPAGQELLLRVQNRTGGLPVTVTEVRFQP